VDFIFELSFFCILLKSTIAERTLGIDFQISLDFNLENQLRLTYYSETVVLNNVVDCNKLIDFSFKKRNRRNLAIGYNIYTGKA
jgi:hypothetical protein